MSAQKRRFGRYLYYMLRLPESSLWARSSWMGAALRINATQIRRDLTAQHEKLGRRGQGYRSSVLRNYLSPDSPVIVAVVGDSPMRGEIERAIRTLPSSVITQRHADLGGYGWCDLAVLAFFDRDNAEAALLNFREYGVKDFLNLGDYLLWSEEETIDNAHPMVALLERAMEVVL